MMTYKDIFNSSYKYLQEISPVSDLDKYFVGDNSDPQDLKNVFREFIRTAQDYKVRITRVFDQKDAQRL